MLAVLAIAGVAGAAHAGEQTGSVDYLLVRQADGLTYFTVQGVATGKPACATQGYWMIANENSTAGKAILALVTAAKAAGQTIRVTGSNTCTRWSDGEDVASVQVL